MSRPTEPGQALKHLEPRIRDAWLDVRPDRRAAALAMRSHDGGHPIAVDIADGPGGDPFACQPALGLIHMKWWALEVLWLAAYALHELGGRLAADAEGGTRERTIEDDPALRPARDALAHASATIERKEPLAWPAGAPHPLDDTAPSARATETFVAALGWIQQHEALHVTIDRAPLGGDDVEEERRCDAHATTWLLDGVGSDGRLREGVAVALLLLVLREALTGRGPDTHPSAAERVAATRIAARHAGWLAVLIDLLLQSGGHDTPALDRIARTPHELLSAELETLDAVLRPAAPPAH